MTMGQHSGKDTTERQSHQRADHVGRRKTTAGENHGAEPWQDGGDESWWFIWRDAGRARGVLSGRQLAVLEDNFEIKIKRESRNWRTVRVTATREHAHGTRQ